MMAVTTRRPSFLRCLVLGLSLFCATLASPRGASAETKTHHHVPERVASTHRVRHYASTSHHFRHYASVSHHLRHYASRRRLLRYARWREHQRYAARYWHFGVQCVPYAREVSHIELSGDAFLWWAEASGRYARGNLPMQGAVLNFRAIPRMPLGHVAVVTAVINSRTILVTQANWVPGAITNDVTVRDVSPGNNWSLVQVELDDTSTLGAPYPTYGFIYDQPAIDTTVASVGTPAQGNEVAEAPRVAPVLLQAPNRNLQ